MIWNRRAWTLLAVVVLITAVSGSCLAGVFKVRTEEQLCFPTYCRKSSGEFSGVLLCGAVDKQGNPKQIGFSCRHAFERRQGWKLNYEMVRINSQLLPHRKEMVPT